MKTCLYFVLTLLTISCGASDELERIKKLNNELKGKYQKQQIHLQKALKSGEKFDFLKRNMKNITATIKTTVGDIDLKFYPETSPLTVYSFIVRAEAGFYEGTKFHRIMPGFMIQAGDPNTKDDNVNDDGQGGSIVNQPHEFNTKKHTRGILSTARVPDISSGAGSQFFIMHAAYPSLDNKYTIFGEVTKGLEIVDAIATAKQRKSPPNYPVSPVVIKEIIVKR